MAHIGSRPLDLARTGLVYRPSPLEGEDKEYACSREVLDETVEPSMP
jgi:hypothetical protein